MSPPEFVSTRRAPVAEFPKERPMLYTGSMVRAVLRAVDPKTQTRRLVNRLADFGSITEFGPSDTSGYDWHFRDREMRWHDISHARLLECCPYGLTRDHLWIREAHAFSVCDPEGSHWTEDPENWDVIYRADPQQPAGGWPDTEGALIEAPWRPSIHMPRWASRINLEIAGVRVERLQDISKQDAQAEGITFTDYGRKCGHGGKGWTEIGDCPAAAHTHPQLPGWGLEPANHAQCMHSAPAAFASLWSQINGTESWASNPWVWVVDFRRVKP